MAHSTTLAVSLFRGGDDVIAFELCIGNRCRLFRVVFTHSNRLNITCFLITCVFQRVCLVSVVNLIIVMDLIIHNFELHSIVYAMSSLVVHIIIIMQLALK